MLQFYRQNLVRVLLLLVACDNSHIICSLFCFPGDFVKKIFISVRELCKVLFPYPPSNEDELELKEGDIISIINKELPDKGWWKGELRGKIGVFPDNFVVPLSPEGISIGKKKNNLTIRRHIFIIFIFFFSVNAFSFSL